jgi:hypothetical protein
MRAQPKFVNNQRERKLEIRSKCMTLLDGIYLCKGANKPNKRGGGVGHALSVPVTMVMGCCREALLSCR